MFPAPILLVPDKAFWAAAARLLCQTPFLVRPRVIVPTATHARLLKEALMEQGTSTMPRMTTLSAWLEQSGGPEIAVTTPSSRLMSLYAELRQHAWLKKLFTARRNTDLLPLAQILLTLSDELTQALLPQLRLAPAVVDERWQTALEQLTPSARQMLSDEAQLVWTIWKSQLDGADACAARFTRMMRLAEHADAPLVWIEAAEADAFDLAFIEAWSARQEVMFIAPDWRASASPSLYAAAWPEAMSDASDSLAADELDVPQGLALCRAKSMEDEAQQGAQSIINWLTAGKSSVAIVAQDRAVARRIRALLERAQIFVADETGWKLSTTRAAAAVAAWFEVIASRAETVALLDLLKSPFLFADVPDKSMQVMRIELALRRANVPGGWDAALSALEDAPQERELLLRIAAQAARFAQRKSLLKWIDLTLDAFDELGISSALSQDAAGRQVLDLLDSLKQDCRQMGHAFSIAEWRALVCLQLESIDFIPEQNDRRVVMLPLNGARLRSFDAALVVGADADHLPSQASETLFFANAVRRELGLATRESLQRQQLRDFIAVLCTCDEVVLSWQAHKDGEANAVSPWIARLQLTLERRGHRLREHRVALTQRELTFAMPSMPAPAAPQFLPKRLSASGYNKLVACPYQFFASHMLGLAPLDELSDLPQKRDYGEWLHQVLKKYHDTLAGRPIAPDARAALLAQISESVFGPVLIQNPAALGYYVRWQKAMPAYIAWANERESKGWRFAFGEKQFRKSLQWEGGEVMLHGWIDRMDENDAGDVALMDYKAINFTSLKKRLDQREDHQLAFYGLIADRPVAAAHYVSLEPYNDKMRDAPAAEYPQWQQQLKAQIVDNLRAISQGAPLPASGIEMECQYCDVRGLCRKGAW
ncbi:MAG: PD-(D/E)XK nuclease family protein [Burkholderiales bacterium]|nr:PD-(D/E)XK nuclease family protein [Burkholderiales bacterium]